ncbi:MAG TPA: YeeE/YedE thiosulfate transporter family protein [Longimicrobiales bacterium]|nr:YeeE/YedE thiosulfate transporter family protein [Longimicrobiales bacterium]
MIAPFFVSDDAALKLALPIGIGFGWMLERAGFGNARKLAGQFYFKDFTVFKVMFTAIITAALGVFWFARLGWLDMSQVAIPPTYLLPQLAGGLIFGAGFVIGGLCPGTSCVAAASGRLDGLAVVVGMFAGVFGFGELLPRFTEFYLSTNRGELTLDQWSGLDRGAIIFVLTAFAIGMFALIDAFEKKRAASES